ncbi:hypothetical protein NEFER03_0970 [Nematocida sp. LUAm3]|nr:hypothetical protein NEFER03_0970 [Nematocida sp. LUAm3]KAI5175426.1 hypothetical protein NEFER02_1355 [Nematocida sp. LUAm2]KAI5177617.1 hypothetical protein NEFER01_0841 [Nematocida sp. LUAm1]
MIRRKSTVQYEGIYLPIDMCILIGTSISVLFLYTVFNALVTCLIPKPIAPTSGPITPRETLLLVPIVVRYTLLCCEIPSLVILNAMLIFGFLARDILDIMFNIFVQMIIILYSLWSNFANVQNIYTIFFISARIVYIVYLLLIILQVGIFSQKRFAWTFFKTHGLDIEINQRYMMRQTVKIAYKTFIILFFFRWVLDQTLLENLTLMIIDISLYALQLVSGLYIDVESYLLRLFMIATSFGVCVFYLIQIIFSKDFINFAISKKIVGGLQFFEIWVVIISLVIFIELFYIFLLIMDMRSFGANLKDKNIIKSKRKGILG